MQSIKVGVDFVSTFVSITQLAAAKMASYSVSITQLAAAGWLATCLYNSASCCLDG